MCLICCRVLSVLFCLLRLHFSRILKVLMQHFLLHQSFAIQERLHRGLTVAVATGMRSSAIVGIHPIIDIVLQLLHAGVELFAESNLIKLHQYRAMKPLANAIGLR